MAEYKGKTVTLNRPRAIPKGSPGYGKKRKEVFVVGCSSESSRVKRITFGDAKLGMHKDSKARKKSYCARSKGMGGTTDRCSANYWARRDWDCQMAKKTKKDACYKHVSKYMPKNSAYRSGPSNYRMGGSRQKKSTGGAVTKRGQGAVMTNRLR